MTRIFIGAGRDAGVSPRDLVGSLRGTRIKGRKVTVRPDRRDGGGE
ncbi:MAG TPA: hypothetical protein VIL46_18605 [Gemmataceae bacterium]